MGAANTAAGRRANARAASIAVTNNRNVIRMDAPIISVRIRIRMPVPPISVNMRRIAPDTRPPRTPTATPRAAT